MHIRREGLAGRSLVIHKLPRDFHLPWDFGSGFVCAKGFAMFGRDRSTFYKTLP